MKCRIVLILSLFLGICFLVVFTACGSSKIPTKAESYEMLSFEVPENYEVYNDGTYGCCYHDPEYVDKPIDAEHYEIHLWADREHNNGHRFLKECSEKDGAESITIDGHEGYKYYETSCSEYHSDGGSLYAHYIYGVTITDDTDSAPIEIYFKYKSENENEKFDPFVAQAFNKFISSVSISDEDTSESDIGYDSENYYTDDDVPKDELIVDSDGKQIYKVYCNDGSISFDGSYSGSGNFIIEISDDNQDLEELVCNEIGDYVVDKTVYVGKGYHYIEIYCTDGAWDLTWYGTGGD